MNLFYFICAIFTFCVISLPTCTSTVIGTAACHVWGEFGTCKAENVPVKSFPKECSSMIYDILDLTTLTVVDNGENPADYLDSLKDTGKPVFVSYFHKSWPDAVQNINQDCAQKEIESWKAYLEKHKVIKGLIIGGLELAPDDKVDNNYTTNLVAYLGFMKKAFPNIAFGININSAAIIDILDTEQLACLDYSKLAAQVEFFDILTTSEPGPMMCTSQEFKHGDVLINTYLETVLKYINSMNIKKDQLLINFFGTPSSPDISDDCALMYTPMCENPNGTYCAETQQSLFEKGKYWKDQVAGFTLKFIDKDDASNCCQCRPYPVFYALLDGFTGNTAPKPCPLFDRP